MMLRVKARVSDREGVSKVTYDVRTSPCHEPVPNSAVCKRKMKVEAEI